MKAVPSGPNGVPTEDKNDLSNHDNRSKKVIVFHWKDCNNRLLNETLEKLDEIASKKWHKRTLFAFNRIKTAFEARSKEYRDAFRLIIKEHAVHEVPMVPSRLDPKQMVPATNEKGKQLKAVPKTKVMGGGMRDYVWKDQVAFAKAFAKLGARTFEVTAHRLTTDELLECELSPKELRACIMFTEDADPEVLEAYYKSCTPDVEDEDDIADGEADAATDDAIPADVLAAVTGEPANGANAGAPN